MADTAFNNSFDNGPGTLGSTWNVDWSVPGQVTLAGSAAMMEWATGASQGHGYGTYTVTAKMSGGQPGPAILLWPADNAWPGPEVDIAEITPDGSGRQYGTVHWNDHGDAYDAQIYSGVSGNAFHTYSLLWEPGKASFSVDGVTKAVQTDHVPVDYAHGGTNEVIGLLNNSNATSLVVTDVSYTPLGGSAAASTSVAASFSATAAPAATSYADLIAADTHDGIIDWNAVAAAVTANFNATGSWHL